MEHELDTDKEPSCLWKPLGRVGEKCGERDAFCRDGCSAAHMRMLCLASSSCILDQLNAESNCSKGRNSLRSIQLNITFV